MYNKEQSKDKIVESKTSGLSTMHLTHIATSYPQAIELTALEAMWLGHEENIDHPAGEEYPIGTNKEHMSLMVDRVIDSVNHREGIDINADYEIEFISHSFPATA
ncbi:hypothetical protein N8955_00830 [bacterium]|nr:hypothetical protein [Hellea sp.]MDA7807256.1 hypothetical protein [bacterium]MDA9047788.1 hypothetical protein [Hellea sp.]MDA9225336.1 hypothetical protein [bacterium]